MDPPSGEAQNFSLASCTGSTHVLQRAKTLPSSLGSSPVNPDRQRAASFSNMTTKLERARSMLEAGDLVFSDTSLQGLTCSPVSAQAEALGALIRRRSDMGHPDQDLQVADFKRRLSMGSPFRVGERDDEQERLFAPSELSCASPAENPSESAPVSSGHQAAKDQVCSICCAELHQQEGSICECDTCTASDRGGLAPSEQICDCGYTMCHECIATYIENTIEQNRFSCPIIRCPGCCIGFRCRKWRRFVSESLFSRFADNAKDLLSLRCYECDMTRSLFAQFPSNGSLEARAQLKQEVLKWISCKADRKAFLDACRRYGRGEMSADDLITAADGVFASERRLTQVFFFLLPAQIMDIEQRARLQLTFFRRYPKIVTPCCGTKMCFKCKIAGHHPGRSCDQVMKELFEIIEHNHDGDEFSCIQFCPECGVATFKTEGCNEIICLCGAVWEWNGLEFWDNDIHYDSDGENDTEFYQDQKHILDTYLDLHMDF